MKATRFFLAFLTVAASSARAELVHVYQRTVAGAATNQLSDTVLETGASYTTQEAPAISGYLFTHWSISTAQPFTNRDRWGRALDAAPYTLYEETTLTANYLPASQDSDADGVPDGHELYWYGSLVVSALSDTDGDKLPATEEVFRGTRDFQPVNDMKKNRIFIATFALLCGPAMAATVPVGTYVCNPGAQVRVPVMLDSARGLVGVSVTLAYDPQVAVCSRVEPGDLDEVFDDDFLVSNEGDGTVTASIFKLGSNVAEDIGGTVATFVFLARNGTAGEFSDVTVTKVELLEESGVRDATVNNPVSTKNGMIRVMAADAPAARMEEAQTVVADSRLGSIALSAGDGIQASDAGTPIIVFGAVTAPGAVIPVAAPDHGWATAVYTLLKTPTAGLGFASATNTAERLAVTETRANGISTYELVVASVDGLAVLSLDDDLDASLQAYVRDCVGRPAGVDTVWVEGGSRAVSMARAFGIRPAVVVYGDYAEAAFAMPSLSVTAFNPAAGTITAAVEPGEGNAIAGSGKVTGIVEVLGSDALGEAMLPMDRVEIDLSSYFSPGTAGEIRCRATFGDNRFFQVRIADE